MAFIIPNATDTASGQRFANLDQAEPDSLDFQILGHASTNNVISGCGVTANSNTSVDVASGSVLIDGTKYDVSALNGFDLGGNTQAPQFARFDLVVARLSGGSVSIVRVKGNDELTNPEFPPSEETLQSGVIFDGTQHISFSTDVVLAAVYRLGSANILDANIADKRVFVPKITANQVIGIDGDGLVLNTSTGVLDVADMAQNRVKARSTQSTGNPQDVAISANHVLGRDGSGPLGSTQVQTGMIADDAVTEAKLDDAIVSQLLPAGTIAATIRSSADTGWLLLNGSTVVGANTLYPELWAVVPTAWKSGSSLLLPDMSNRMLFGQSSNVGATGGANSKTIAEANLPRHDHDMGHGHSDSFGISDPAHNHTVGIGVDDNTTDLVERLASNTSPQYVIPYDSNGDGYADGLDSYGNYNPSSPTPVTQGMAVDFISSHGHSASTTGPATNKTVSELTNISVTGQVTGHTGNTGDGGFSNTALDVTNAHLSVNFQIKAH